MIRVERASAYGTVQDAGRGGYLASGVPRAGAMDLPAVRTLNAMLGNNAGAAVIECALTGGEIVFESGVTFALGGAMAAATLDDAPVAHYQVHHGAEGSRLRFEPPAGGRFLYLAFAGGVDVPLVMRSRSTYLPGAFGGIDGRRWRAGDAIAVGKQASRTRHQVSSALPTPLRPPIGGRIVRFVPRGDSAVAAEWTVAAASDRMGFRLEGSAPVAGASITSEPVCPGTIQLPPSGQPIVLMADAPTIGGYRVAGAVISADLGILAQKLPGETVTLEPVTVELAQREIALLSARIDSIKEWSLR